MTVVARDEKTYSPDADRQRGMRIWIDMVRDLWSTRELVWRLAHRDVAVSYRQSLLGYLWALLLPIATVALFTYLSNARILPIGETVLPYPVYALLGIVVWQLFAGVLVATTSSLAYADVLVTKIDFPKEAIVFGSLGRPLFDSAIKLLLVLAVLLAYEVPLSASLLLIFPVLALIVVMATGLGLVFSLANMVVRDVATLMGMIATFGVFAAPVLYPAPLEEPFTLIVVLNPFSPLLMATQDLVAYGAVRYPLLLAVGAVVAMTCFLVGWRVFRLVIRRVAERA